MMLREQAHVKPVLRELIIIILRPHPAAFVQKVFIVLKGQKKAVKREVTLTRKV